jgi:hypothetical protein
MVALVSGIRGDRFVPPGESVGGDRKIRDSNVAEANRHRGKTDTERLENVNSASGRQQGFRLDDISFGYLCVRKQNTSEKGDRENMQVGFHVGASFGRREDSNPFAIAICDEY